MRPLQVDTLPRGVRGDQNHYVLVLSKRFLDLAAFLSFDAAVDIDHGLGSSQERANAAGEIGQGIPMLGEDDQFPPLPFGAEHGRFVLQQPR